MKYILNDSVMLHEVEHEGIYISVTGKDVLTVKEDNKMVFMLILNAFLHPCTIDDCYKIVIKTQYFSKTDFNDCIDLMKKYNLLKLADDGNCLDLTDFQLEKFKRQISSLCSLPSIEINQAKNMMKKIVDSSVCIIGVGGTGSHLALTLTSIGVGKLILIDYDDIELSNTSRQVLYDETDIGKKKLDVAKEKLKKYNSTMDIKTFSIHIQSPLDLSVLDNDKIDLIVLCADTPRGEIQYFVDEYTQTRIIPWFGYGPFNHSQIAIGPMIIPKKTKSYLELFPHKVSSVSDDVKFINNRFISSICDPYNGFASQFAGIECFKFLSGYCSPQIVSCRYYVNTDDWTIKDVRY